MTKSERCKYFSNIMGKITLQQLILIELMIIWENPLFAKTKGGNNSLTSDNEHKFQMWFIYVYYTHPESHVFRLNTYNVCILLLNPMNSVKVLVSECVMYQWLSFIVLPTVRLCIRQWPRWRRESVQNYETVYRTRWWQDKNWYYSNETPIPTNIHKIWKQLGETSFFFIYTFKS